MEKITQELDATNDRTFESGKDFLDEVRAVVTQRWGDQDRETQAMLTDKHWKDKLAAAPAKPGRGELSGRERAVKVAAKTNSFGPKSPGRTTEDVIGLAKGILKELADGSQAPKARLKLYRTMDNAEAEGILAWFADRHGRSERLLSQDISSEELRRKTRRLDDDGEEIGVHGGVMPVYGHLGDDVQATSYLDAKRPGEQKKLEFTLEPGAQQILFRPDVLVVAATGQGATAALTELADLDGEVQQSGSGGEGKAAGYIGLKPEDRGDFSLAIGSSTASQLLFQLLVESVRAV